MDEPRYCSQCGSALAGGEPIGLCARCLLQCGMESHTAGFSETADASHAWNPPPPEELSRQFADVEILELIGRGGMGAVYKARQNHLDRIVALKILPPDIGDESQGAFAGRFAREARALARLNHPNIVTLYEFGCTPPTLPVAGVADAGPGSATPATEGGLYYFLMEYVDGVNLRRLIDAGRVAPREALAIVPQVCDALQYAHDHGVVHRDIKPENILLDRQGRVKVADFGLAKIVGQAESAASAKGQAVATPSSPPVTDAGKVVGTPHYMAPEQLSHPADVDHRADIYALGVVFYQMLTGELPAAAIEPPSRKVQIDVRLDEVVMRALDADPNRRYSQASVMKTQVESIASDPAAPQRAGLSPARSSSGARTPRLSPFGTSARRTLFIFGLLDLGIVLQYAREFPGYLGDFGRNATLSTLLLVWFSLAGSGYGLIRGRPWALVLNYFQFPFRIAFAFVSFGWLAGLIAPQNAPFEFHEVVWVSAVALEGIRLGLSIMIHWAHRHAASPADAVAGGFAGMREIGVRGIAGRLLLLAGLVGLPALAVHAALREIYPVMWQSTGTFVVFAPTYLSNYVSPEEIAKQTGATTAWLNNSANLESLLKDVRKKLGPGHQPPASGTAAFGELTVHLFAGTSTSQGFSVAFSDRDPWVAQAVVHEILIAFHTERDNDDEALPEVHAIHGRGDQIVSAGTILATLAGTFGFIALVRRRPITNASTRSPS